MDKCIHDKGYCEILSDNEVKQPCIEGPCKDETRLLPCPFCGGEARLRKVIDNCFVECGKCWAHGPNVLGCEKTEEEAIEAWNRRATCTKGTE